MDEWSILWVAVGVGGIVGIVWSLFTIYGVFIPYI